MYAWNDGYFTDLTYVDNYIVEMNPLMLQLNLTLAGIRFGDTKQITTLENLHYLELGFGQGSSLNIHAAAQEGYFMGTDFNPDHAIHAQAFAKSSHAYLKIFDSSFEEILAYVKQKELSFDVIVLHGVWSWISHANQRIILEIIKHALKIGGVVCVSYNCFPGWLSRHAARTLLMQLYQQTHGIAANRIAQAIMMFEEFLNQETLFATAENKDFLEEIKKKDPAYIAHEYLNADWNCCYFTDMVEDMRRVKCDFVSSARILDHFDMSTHALLGPIEDRILQEQLQDYCLNRRFRMDLFMRGKQHLGVQEGIQKILNTSFVLIKLPKYFKHTPRLKGNIFENFIQKILDFLAQDSYRPKTGKEIFEKSTLPFKEFITSLSVIIHQGIAMPAHKPSDAARVKAQAYNRHLFEQQTMQSSCIFAASPITGGGIIVSEVEQLFIYAIKHGYKSFEDIRTYTWNLLRMQNRWLAFKENHARNEEENMALLQNSLKEFLDEKQALFKALEIF